MVAYSFKAQFAGPIIDGTKCQTIRANRKRHARVGEAIQLYAGMRTKHCRKLLEINPICTHVETVQLEIGDDPADPLFSVSIDGRRLCDVEIEEVALMDGFTADDVQDATQRMGQFWLSVHGAGIFDGVLISWGASE